MENSEKAEPENEDNYYEMPPPLSREELNKLSQESLEDLLIEANGQIRTLVRELNLQIKQNLRKELALQKLSEHKEKSDFLYNGYRLDWLLMDKVKFIITRNKKFLRSAKIASELLWLEGENSKKWKHPDHSIRQVLHKATSLGGTLARLRYPGYKGYHYGLPEWINENNQVKKPYIP